ncbi:methyltransferase, FxLD system [Amycolatopsis pigmentata]|uniref:Protein-L-isoaspartate O-methyltransferase n=1 Tax=Amycolatopsis pigmentata TaxID=450801 RepID=A0ABW5G2M6_9PSEU
MRTTPESLRKNLVERLRVNEGVVGERVLDAFGSVPRHLFLPGVPVDEAYEDLPIVIKRDGEGKPISSSSQPAIMALMLEQLALEPGLRVLEIGAGTGYNAALMHRLVSPGGEVVSVDIDADLVAGARENLDRAGYPGVTVVRADGAEGRAERAPYDRVIATVGVWDLAPAWFDQLAPGGRIVVPLDLGGPQRSVAFEAEDGHWASRSVLPCGFMRIRGSFAGPEQTRVLNRDTEFTITLPHGGEHDPRALPAAFAGPAVRVPVGVAVDPRALFGGLGLWIAGREPAWCLLTESTGAETASLPEAPLTMRDQRYTAGLLAPDGIAVFAGRTELAAVGYGPAGGERAHALASLVRDWDAAGRPGDRGLRVDAYPVAGPEAVPAGGPVIEKTHTRLVLSWSPA